MSTIHIYYHKKKIFLYFLLCLLGSIFFCWYLYDNLFYDYVTVLKYSRKCSLATKYYVPFVFPESLSKISILGLLGLIFCFAASCRFLQWLLHKGPIVIVTSQGIQQMPYGLVPWHEVDSISKQEFKGNKYVQIKLNRYGRCFSDYKNIFGSAYIALIPDIMYTQQIDSAYNSYMNQMLLK